MDWPFSAAVEVISIQAGESAQAWTALAAHLRSPFLPGWGVADLHPVLGYQIGA